WVVGPCGTGRVRPYVGLGAAARPAIEVVPYRESAGRRLKPFGSPFPSKHSDYHGRMEAPGRRFVSRTCMVCEWRGEAVEHDAKTVECPWCHAPTRITRQEWLIPMLGGKDPHAAAAAALSR